MGSASGGSAGADTVSWTARPAYKLSVKQQPKRARLCSYKEGNETIDRRPVDPPPIVELSLADGRDIGPDQLLEATSFFIRATIVNCSPVTAASSPLSTGSPFSTKPLSRAKPIYAPVKTPLGADATTGEVIQTPENLRLLDGRLVPLCIFAKISVRVPGIFRLEFTLYETSEYGVHELTSTVSDPFEVFSPKLFKGMHESTPLTRHLADQGLKVKLRTDTTIGRVTKKRQRLSGQGAGPSQPSTYQKPIPSAPSIQPIQSAPTSKMSPISPVRHPSRESLSTSNSSVSQRTVSESPRHLVWRVDSEEKVRPVEPVDHYAIEKMGAKMKFMDDGLVRPFEHAGSSYMDWSIPTPSTDLSAFSLSRIGNTSESPRYGSTSHDVGRPSSQGSASHQSSRQTYPSHHYSPNWGPSSSMNLAPLSLKGPSHSTHISTRTRMKLGDTGIPILPLPNVYGPSGQGELVPPSVNQVLSGPSRKRSLSHESLVPIGHPHPSLSTKDGRPFSAGGVDGKGTSSFGQYNYHTAPPDSPLTLPPLRPLLDGDPKYDGKK